jgi:hypothetical protein
MEMVKYGENYENDVISLINGENGTRPTPFPAPECLTGADSKW